MNRRRLHIAHHNKRCYAQHAATTKQIAEYQNLKIFEKYAEHGLRQSSAYIIVEGDPININRRRLRMACYYAQDKVAILRVQQQNRLLNTQA